MSVTAGTSARQRDRPGRASASKAPMPPAAEPSGAVLMHGISELVTNDPAAGPGLLGIIPNAALILQDGHLVWVGQAGSAPAADGAVDLNGRAVLPGWVDSHTQMIFARDRVGDFTARLR